MLTSGGVPTIPKRSLAPLVIIASIKVRRAAAAAEERILRLMSSLRRRGVCG